DGDAAVGVEVAKAAQDATCPVEHARHGDVAGAGDGPGVEVEGAHGRVRIELDHQITAGIPPQGGRPGDVVGDGDGHVQTVEGFGREPAQGGGHGGGGWDGGGGTRR